jgi:hypothetical protein
MCWEEGLKVPGKFSDGLGDGHAVAEVTSSVEGAVRPLHLRTGTGVAATVLALAYCLAGTPARAADPTTAAGPPSAIGSESPAWIQAAPNYTRTGLVIAVAGPTASCTTGCNHLWVSHDGGATWHRAAGNNWDGGRPAIAVDGRGHDVLFSDTSKALMRSDDAGDNWVAVGQAGEPTIAPSYPTDGAVAVAVPQGGDYLLTNSGQSPLPGSGGSVYDFSFAYAPSYPSTGRYSPVLMTAEDRKQRLPIIQQCTKAFACSGSSTLAGAVYFSSPVTLHPSTAYATDGTVFAQSGRGIYKSVDGGISFALLSIGDPTATATATPMLALAPSYSEHGATRTAWAAVFQIFQNQSDPKKSHPGGGIFRTDDGGTTWHAQDTPGPFDGGSEAMAVGSDGRLFAGYVGGTSAHAGLLCSTDGGSTWQAACPKVGDGANDPGLPAGTKVQVCTSCVKPSSLPSAGATPAAASTPVVTAGTAKGASDPALAATGRTATGGQTGTRPGWIPIVVVVAIVLAFLAALTALLPRIRGRHSD